MQLPGRVRVQQLDKRRNSARQAAVGKLLWRSKDARNGWRLSAQFRTCKDVSRLIASQKRERARA
eukprot:5275018-Pleurochrysis_carterae.AAC.1